MLTPKKLSKISIITPCLNSKDYIEKCINSVLSQSYGDIEYIIVDGGSTDGTIQLIKKYSGRFKYISEKDSGNYDAIKKGFALATGNIFTWLDSDNFYYSNEVIEKIAAVFNDQDPDIVMTDSYVHYQGSKKMHLVHPDKLVFNYIALINKGNMITPESLFYKKDIYNQAGGLNLDFKYLSDYDLWIRMLKLQPSVIKMPIITSVYEVRQDALLRRNLRKAWKEFFLIGEKFQRSLVSKLKFRIIYLGLLIRAPFLSIIRKSPFLIKLFIKVFR